MNTFMMEIVFMSYFLLVEAYIEVHSWCTEWIRSHHTLCQKGYHEYH